MNEQRIESVEETIDRLKKEIEILGKQPLLFLTDQEHLNILKLQLPVLELEKKVEDMQEQLFRLSPDEKLELERDKKELIVKKNELSELIEIEKLNKEIEIIRKRALNEETDYLQSLEARLKTAKRIIELKELIGSSKDQATIDILKKQLLAEQHRKEIQILVEEQRKRSQQLSMDNSSNSMSIEHAVIEKKQKDLRREEQILQETIELKDIKDKINEYLKKMTENGLSEKEKEDLGILKNRLQICEKIRQLRITIEKMRDQLHCYSRADQKRLPKLEQQLILLTKEKANVSQLTDLQVKAMTSDTVTLKEKVRVIIAGVKVAAMDRSFSIVKPTLSKFNPFNNKTMYDHNEKVVLLEELKKRIDSSIEKENQEVSTFVTSRKDVKLTYRLGEISRKVDNALRNVDVLGTKELYELLHGKLLDKWIYGRYIHVNQEAIESVLSKTSSSLEPDPAAEPELEPAIVAPDPVAEPELEPAIVAPDLAAEPELEPVIVAPDPVAEPELEPAIVAPDPVAEPELEPVIVAPNPVAEPELEPAIVAPDPVAEPELEPAIVAPDPVAEPELEPAIVAPDPVAEPEIIDVASSLKEKSSQDLEIEAIVQHVKSRMGPVDQATLNQIRNLVRQELEKSSPKPQTPTENPIWGETDIRGTRDDGNYQIEKIGDPNLVSSLFRDKSSVSIVPYDKNFGLPKDEKPQGRPNPRDLILAAQLNGISLEDMKQAIARIEQMDTEPRKTK